MEIWEENARLLSPKECPPTARAAGGHSFSLIVVVFKLLTHFSFRILFVCYRLMILIKAFKSYNPCLFGKHHTVIRKFFSAYLFKSL